MSDSPETNLSQLQQEFSSRVEQMDISYTTRLAEIETRVTLLTEQHERERTELMSQVADLQAQLSAANAEVAAKKLSEKLDRLNRMALSDDIKQEYQELITKGMLGDAEDRIFKTLESQSDFNKRALSQYGTASAAVRAPGKQQPPSAFASIVSRNKERASRRNED
jgi:hypothetical protein